MKFDYKESQENKIPPYPHMTSIGVFNKAMDYV